MHSLKVKCIGRNKGEEAMEEITKPKPEYSAYTWSEWRVVAFCERRTEGL
jgi:hypothetical protein